MSDATRAAPADKPAAGHDIRPVVERPRSGPSGWMIAVGALAAALILFLILDSRRRALMAPAVAPTTSALAESAAPPPLYIPPEPAPPPVERPSEPDPATEVLPPPPAPAPDPSPTIVYVPTPQSEAPAPPPQPRNTGGAALVVDVGGARAAPPSTGAGDGAAAPTGGGSNTLSTQRARAASLANRSTTVAQGTLIPAVLETGLDSSHPGFARALVQRDIRGFDGKQVLIPRGSRLVGRYAGNVAQGQKRAYILWSRLIRPDGVTIAIGSPVADPLGRGGVKADVNSHFFARFSGAILQSILDVGVNLASRSSKSPVIVALPGSLQGSAATLVQPNQIAPTLKVKPGASISVFVARDLDFGGAGQS